MVFKMTKTLTAWDIERNVKEELSIYIQGGHIADFDELVEKFDTLVHEEVERAVIYYSDAFDLLKDMQITDFSEAWENGCTDVCSVVAFHLNTYLYEEININEFQIELDEYLEEQENEDE